MITPTRCCQLLQIVATYLTGGLVFYYFRVTIAPIVDLVLCAGGLVLAAECFVRLRVSDYNIVHNEEEAEEVARRGYGECRDEG
jgi:hypothetical protein